MNQIYQIIPILFTCLLLNLSAQGQPPQNGQDSRPFQRVVGVDESSGNTFVNYEKLSKEKEAEVSKLVSMYEQASSEQKTQIRRDLMTALEDLFEINVSKKEAELRALEAELEDVRRGLEFRKMNKTKIVENRLRELLDN